MQFISINFINQAPLVSGQIKTMNEITMNVLQNNITIFEYLNLTVCGRNLPKLLISFQFHVHIQIHCNDGQ